LREKIRKAGIEPYTPVEARFVKLAHKFNVARHISYFRWGGL